MKRINDSFGILPQPFHLRKQYSCSYIKAKTITTSKFPVVLPGQHLHKLLIVDVSVPVYVRLRYQVVHLPLRQPSLS